MTVRCRLCGKERPRDDVRTCHAALRHLEATSRGARCPDCGEDHMACVRFEV